MRAIYEAELGETSSTTAPKQHSRTRLVPIPHTHMCVCACVCEGGGQASHKSLLVVFRCDCQ